LNPFQRIFLFVPLYLLSLLPLQALYFLVSPLFFLLYYFPGYRKKISLHNLTTAFPNKTPKEIQQLQKENYRYICKLIAENIKSISITEKELRKRVQLKNKEVLEKQHHKGKPALVLLGHHGNWELIAQASCLVAPNPFIIVYKPLSNPFFDALLKRNRERFGAITCPMQETPDLIKSKSQQSALFTLVADQNPANPKKAIWTDFFMQDTAFLAGPELLAKRYNLTVLYLDVKCTKSGYYELYPKVLLEDNSASFVDTLTKQYAQHLEESIKTQTTTWLWTHRRWKHKRL